MRFRLFQNLFLLLILLSGPVLFAQNLPKSFSLDTLKFTEDLGKYFESVYDKDQRKEGKLLMEQFIASWLSGKFSKQRELKVMEMANKMLKYKMRPVPHYYEFLSAILAFQETGPEEKSVNAWFAILDKSLDVSSSRKFLAFLDISNKLFRENVLYKSGATKWKSSSNNYSFSYDSVPYVTFPSLDLTCIANGDSSVIHATKGIYYPTVSLWVGKGGKVSWVRAGLAEDQVWADLGNYRIGVRFSKYDADSVVFHNTEYFEKPLLGRLEEKILASSTEDRASFPRFTSYDTRLRINEIFKEIDYEGGFSMRGAKLFGSGNKTDDAYLLFKRKDQVFVRVGSKDFIIRKDRISSSRASITIYWEEDSVYHPGLEMKYMNATRELSMLRTEEGMPQSPYFDSYHKVDIYVEAVYWKMDEPKIDFTMIKGPGGEGNALFESSNYFRESRYHKMQGMDDINPLDRVMSYYKKYHSKDILLEEFAIFIHKPVEVAEAMLLNLAIKGFLIYNTGTKTGYIKDRLFDYLNAMGKRTDYDVIQFNSIITAHSNATLSLLNFEMKLRGVATVYLSDSQAVYIYPTNQELTLQKNRDFRFSGRVHAGLFDFFARDCAFEYTKFKLELPTIDSLSFKVRARETNEYGENPLIRVRTVIRELSGDLLIDQPNNKSGTTSYPEYPIFNSKNDAYVFYDGYGIQKGAYKRDKFFFHVYPFSISNLDKIATDDIKFSGFLVSANIFPDIEEPLKVQPDYSLGFVRQTPPSGFPAYGGKGGFTNVIDMSHRGLKGDGVLKYLSATSSSHDFTFYPDSVKAVLDNYELAENTGQPENPAVKAIHVSQHWSPYKDLMSIRSIDTAIVMYNGEAKIRGLLQLTPAGLTGAGIINVAEAEMDASLFKFKNKVFDSDTANFRLQTIDRVQLAFSTHNYKSHIDFKDRKGEFKSNGGGSKVDFPVNQYICFMDEFEWYMDKEEIALSNSKNTVVPETTEQNMRQLVDIDISGSEFVSTNPKQDSLRFNSPKARYNLRNNIIYAQQVSFIKVADAAIFPDMGKVTIYKDARMDTLKNARVLANTVTKYHAIHEAVINIQSRRSFTGTGQYDYIDDKDVKQNIALDRIAVDSTLQTFAHGKIPDELNFHLNEHFDFSGDARLKASREYLTFTGGYRIHHDCDTLPRAKVRFEAELNPKEIRLPVTQELKDVNNRALFAALAFSQKNNHIYSAFLTNKQNYSDQDVISARGFVQYNPDKEEYQIASAEKLKQPSLPGSLLTLNTKNCLLHGEGVVNLGTSFGQLKISSFGNVDYYIIPDSAKIDLVLSLDFFFADNAMKMIHESLEKTNLPAVDLSKDKYKQALGEMLGVKQADEKITEISLYGGMKRLPSELNHTLLLADVNFKWNSVTNSYVSQGDLGIGNMEKNQINKFVKGYIEISKKRSGDILDIYLEISENEWYYFNYSRGLMQTISSSADFNKIITEMKPDKRTQKGEKGEETYRYNVSTVKKKKDFIRRMENVTE
ncbi:MAG: hypothetical protein WCO63_01035 [Bacteroidota bacterium]